MIYLNSPYTFNIGNIVTCKVSQCFNFIGFLCSCCSQLDWRMGSNNQVTSRNITCSLTSRKNHQHVEVSTQIQKHNRDFECISMSVLLNAYQCRFYLIHINIDFIECISMSVLFNVYQCRFSTILSSSYFLQNFPFNIIRIDKFGPFTSNTKISWPHLGLTLTRVKLEWFHYGCCAQYRGCWPF